VTDQYVSPYTGRPVTEWLDDDLELHDSNGDKIGNIVEVNPDFIVAQASSGFLGLGEPKNYFIPRSYVDREDGNDWYLSVDKDQIGNENWTNAPTTSAWSSDWQSGEYTGEYDADSSANAGETNTTDYNATADQNRTRLRRYEEDVDVNKVQRSAGDVVVNKRVVEETKTIEVPVRREEVSIERRPVSDQTLVGAGADSMSSEAFQEDSIRVPVMQEDVEVRKVARPVEEIEITKTPTEETRQVDATVRREEFDVNDPTGRTDTSDLKS
jgi:uncharacterized protein (TIGR02271 family)